MANRGSMLISDAAVLLGVSRRTIYYRISSGRLETIRTKGGTQRVLLDSIEGLLQSERLARAGQRVAPRGKVPARESDTGERSIAAGARPQVDQELAL